jgi:hypothetical protein
MQPRPAQRSNHFPTPIKLILRLIGGPAVTDLLGAIAACAGQQALAAAARPASRAAGVDSARHVMGGPRLSWAMAVTRT